MKIISWNVNGIRSMLTKGFYAFVESHQPDILCLQETKVGRSSIQLELPGYEQFWHNANKPGYSGTAVFTKIAPLSVKMGMDITEHDQEGRLMTLEFDKYFLVNIYVPNSKRDLSRLPYRSTEWDVALLQYLKSLETAKPVLFCGDLNVAHTEIDLSSPKTNTRSHGFTDEERQGFSNFVNAGFIDLFREFEKGGQHYTWWSPFQQCRARNIGWRIDYFLASKALRSEIVSCYHLPDAMGSDHCPVVVETRFSP